MPCGHARDGDRLLLHGSTGSRLFRAMADGAPAVRDDHAARRPGRRHVAVRVLDALPQRRHPRQRRRPERRREARPHSTCWPTRCCPAAGPTPGRPAAASSRRRRSSPYRIDEWSLKVSDSPPEVVPRTSRLGAVDRRGAAAACTAAYRITDRGGEPPPYVAGWHDDRARGRHPVVWLETCGDDLTPRPALPGHIERRRRDRRRRLHRAVDRPPPAPPRPDAARRGHRTGDRRLGCLRPQRRLVLGAVSGAVAAGRPRLRRGRRASAWAPAAGRPSTTSGRAATSTTSTPTSSRAARCHWPAAQAQLDRRLGAGTPTPG